MDHFKSIGFDSTKLQEYVLNAFDTNLSYRSKHGKYFLLSTDSGAQIIISSKRRGLLRRWSPVAMNPYFQGTTVNKVLIQNIKEDEDHLEATCYGWMNPFESKEKNTLLDGIDGDFPFLFNLDFADRIKKEDLMGVHKIKITCYPHQMFGILPKGIDFQNFLEQLRDKPLKVKVSDQALVCEGLFLGRYESKPISFITAIIESVERRKNEMTGLEFFVCVGQSSKCKMDFVFAVDQTNIIPEVGGKLAGRFWVSGEIISAV